ncbi:hypothetical protein UR09_03635 [Candidatus Nitromaritima sp. SCGC AAA799-A02]|nr:hypothetical protein UR09_03635 [Candidatus Nitromaritima sp. SCGC AAA799-A02]
MGVSTEGFADGKKISNKNSGKKTTKEKILDEVEYLRDRMQRLEERLMELESKAVLSEPELIVKRKDIWVCNDGLEFDDPDSGKCSDGEKPQKSFTYQREKVFRRQTISEKIEETLASEAEKGLSIGLSGTGTLQHAIGTHGADNTAEGNLFGVGSVDLFLIGKPALYTMFFVDIEAIGGFPPDDDINNVSALNSDDARRINDRELNLREVWLSTQLFDQTLSLYGGMLDLTNYFDSNMVANDETTQFITDALVNNPLLGHPANGGGITAIFDPKTGINFKAGIQRGDNAAKSLAEKIYSIFEVGYLSHFGSIPEGHYRAWYRISENTRKENTAYGFSIDQKIDQAVTLFGRFGHRFTDDQVAEDDFSYSGGIQFTTFRLNPQDSWALAFSIQNLGSGVDETLAEAYYNFHLTDNLKTSFHLQHLIDTNAGGTGQGYLLPGMRVQIDF